MLNTAKPSERVAKLADMLSAMGSEPRPRIMRLLLSAHPDGLVVAEIQEELDIPNSVHRNLVPYSGRSALRCEFPPPGSALIAGDTAHSSERTFDSRRLKATIRQETG